MKLRDLKGILIEGVILLELSNEEFPDFEEVYCSYDFDFDESEELEKHMEKTVVNIYSHVTDDGKHFTVVTIE